MKILGIETSSPLFSLCLNEDNKIIYEIKKNRIPSKGRDGQFFDEAKKLIDYSAGQIDVIAVSIGPGMFTSLRIGLSLAKGIAVVDNTPIVAVNTLDVIGMSLAFINYPILAIINAYRGEIYAAIYEQGERKSDYLLTTPDAVKKLINTKTMVVGPGIEFFKDRVSETNNLQLVDAVSLFPTASKVVSVALPRIRNKKFDDPDFLEPYYIKKTDAERCYNKSNAV